MDGQIVEDHTGMFPGDLDIPGKREIVTDHYLTARHQTGRKAFVMAVTDTEYPTVVRITGTVGDFEQTDVAGSIMKQTLHLDLFPDLNPEFL
jgi:hypothetical protein